MNVFACIDTARSFSPILERTGLEHHYDLTQALFQAIGGPAFTPARRARVARRRA